MKQPATIIYYHGSCWADTPSRQQYLSAALSEYARVIFLEDGGRLIRSKQVSDNITVVTGLVRLLTGLERRKLGFLAHLVGAFYRQISRIAGPVVFWNAECAIRPYRFIPHDSLVYDCMDPCFGTDKELIESHKNREQSVLLEADVVFATSKALLKDCQFFHQAVYLLNNACEPSEYASGPRSSTIPLWWKETDQPVAAYLGSLDWRFAFEFMLAVVQQNPQIHFVFAGKVLSQFQSLADRFRALENVTVTGKVSVEDGRFLLDKSSVCLIAFESTFANDRINPVKLYSYAFLGKPVVAIRTAELDHFSDLIHVANTVDEFTTLLRTAVIEAGNLKKRQELQDFAKLNTWAERARTAWERLSDPAITY